MIYKLEAMVVLVLKFFNHVHEVDVGFLNIKIQRIDFLERMDCL